MTLSSNDSEETNQVEPSAGQVSPEVRPEIKTTLGSAPVRRPGGKSSGKVIAVVALIFAIGIGGLILQRSSSTPKTVKLTAHDMQLIFQELLPPQQQQQIASDPEEKKKLVGEIKKLLAVAQVAEQEGYAEHPDIKSQLAFQQDMDLNNAYRKKNSDAKASDEEVNAYHLAHPKDFDDF